MQVKHYLLLIRRVVREYLPQRQWSSMPLVDFFEPELPFPETFLHYPPIPTIFPSCQQTDSG